MVNGDILTVYRLKKSIWSIYVYLCNQKLKSNEHISWNNRAHVVCSGLLPINRLPETSCRIKSEFVLLKGQTRLFYFKYIINSIKIALQVWAVVFRQSVIVLVSYRSFAVRIISGMGDIINFFQPIFNIYLINVLLFIHLRLKTIARYI